MSSDHRILSVAYMLGAIVALVLLLAVWTAHVSHESCSRVNRLEQIVQQQGKRGLKTLGTKNGEAYAYYQAHPSELATARRDLRAQIDAFAPKSCSIFS